MPPRTRAAREAEERKKQAQGVFEENQRGVSLTSKQAQRGTEVADLKARTGEGPQISARGRRDLLAARAEREFAPPPELVQGQVFTGEQAQLAREQRAAQLRERVEQGQRAGVQPFSAAAQTIEQSFTEDIENRRSLAPTSSLGELGTEVGGAALQQAGFAQDQLDLAGLIGKTVRGTVTKEDFKKIGEGALRRGIVGGSIAAAALIPPIIMKTGAGQAVSKATSSKIFPVSTFAVGLLAASVGGGPIDLGRSTIEVQRGKISEISSQNDAIVGSVKAGMDATIGVRDILAMQETIDRAEEAIIVAGNYNAKFRFSREYEELEEEIADARRNLREGILDIRQAVENGEAQYDPIALATIVQQL